MITIYELQARAQQLRSRTQEGSITPEDVGGLMADILTLLAAMEQAANSLHIAKVYTSKAAMEADTAPEGKDGKPLHYGQLAAVNDGGDNPDNGSIYAYQAPGWKLIGNLNKVSLGKMSGQAYPGVEGAALEATVKAESKQRERDVTQLQEHLTQEIVQHGKAIQQVSVDFRSLLTSATQQIDKQHKRDVDALRELINGKEGFKAAVLTESEYLEKVENRTLEEDRCYFIIEEE